MTEQEKYDQSVRAFLALEKWAIKAKELLGQFRDHPKTDARLSVAAKCLIWDWKGDPAPEGNLEIVPENREG